MPIHLAEAVADLVERPTIEPRRGDDMAARLHQRVEGEELRGVPRSGRQRGHAAFERGHLAFERAVGRVHQPGVDIPRNFEIERSEEHTSELQSLMRISYAVFCLKKKKIKDINITIM